MRRKASAAVEFAVATPFLTILLGDAADFGLSQASRAQLSNAVAAGAQYAYNTGSSVTSANIKSLVEKVSGLDVTSLTVTVTGPARYCVTGTGPTMTAQTSQCSDGSSPGLYAIIAATYTTQGLMNGFMAAASLSTSESATVRIQ